MRRSDPTRLFRHRDYGRQRTAGERPAANRRKAKSDGDRPHQDALDRCELVLHVLERLARHDHVHGQRRRNLNLPDRHANRIVVVARLGDGEEARPPLENALFARQLRRNVVVDEPDRQRLEALVVDRERLLAVRELGDGAEGGVLDRLTLGGVVGE